MVWQGRALTWLSWALQRESCQGGKKCVDELPRQGTAAGRLGHRRQALAPLLAAKEAASMPGRQLLSGSAATAAAPSEMMFPAKQVSEPQVERQEQNQSSVEEREAEKARNKERARPNLAPPMGSVAAQRQVIISKLGACSPGLVGGRKGRGSPRELHSCPWRQRLLPPFPHSSRTSCPQKCLLHTLYLEISDLNINPKL